MQEFERAIRLELAAQLVGDVLDGVEEIEEGAEEHLRLVRKQLKAMSLHFRGIGAPPRRTRRDAGTKREQVSLPLSE